MKKSLFAAASLAAMIAATPPVLAQMNDAPGAAPGHTAPVPPPAAPTTPMGAPAAPAAGDAKAAVSGMVRADSFEGLPVKNSAGAEIGSVKDVILDADGALSGLVLNAGGVLGVGGRDVLVSAAEIQTESGSDSQLSAVSLTSAAENLDGFPAFSYDADTAEAGVKTLPADGASAAELVGSAVTTGDGKTVGTIDGLILDLSSRTANATIASGGFMGVNAERVVVAMNDLTITKAPDEDLKIRIDKPTFDNAPRLAGAGG